MPIQRLLTSIRNNRIRAGLYGVLLGDMIGLPYEFGRQSELPEPNELSRILALPDNHPYAKPTWSSDGAQTLALLDSLQHCQRLDLDDFGRRLLDWRDHGAYTQYGHAIGCGITTYQALERIKYGIPAEKAGNRDDYSLGNGSLMRCLALVFWHQGDDHELIRLAIRQSLPTHAHPLCGIACALLCLVARRLLQNQMLDWNQLRTELSSRLTLEEYAVLPRLFEAPQRQFPQGTACVVDSFWSAIATLNASSLELAIIQAIRFGNDTNTTACLAGGLAGLRWGQDEVLNRYLLDFTDRHLVIDRLIF